MPRTQAKAKGRPKFKAGQTRLVAVGELRHFPGNAWKGDVGAIARSLERLGQYRAIVVNVREGTRLGDLCVLAGNHTLESARDELGWKKIRCQFVDVDDATAEEINVADNRLPQLGAWDDAALADLLTGVAERGEEALTVTGFDQPTLEGLKVPTPEAKPPEEFAIADPDAETDFCCPSCGYEWSGNAA